MNIYKKVYAAYANDNDLRLSSSSGAMFSLLAHHILLLDGIVYGVKMADDCYSAEYERVEDISSLSQLRGSKYFQAKVGDTYSKVKQDLSEGRKVLFTGTGCSVNGLKTFLQKEYDNLYCMDIVCHGTPSPKLWEKYVKFREEEIHSKVIYVSFRNKDKHDWNGFEMKEVDEDHREMWISRHIDPYFQMFVKNVCLRPSCYTCTAKYYKLSDLTVADFWGVDNVAPDMNDNLGVSLVITRSNKGQQLFDNIQDQLKRKEVSYEDGVKENMSEYKSHSLPQERNDFYKDMNNMTFRKLTRKYVEISIWKKIIRKGKKVLKHLLIRSGVNERNVHTHGDYEYF